MNASAHDFDHLFSRERWLVMRERHRQAIRMRWFLTFLAVGMAAVGRITGALEVGIVEALALSGTTAATNTFVLWRDRAGAFAPWQFWFVQAADGIVMAAFAAALGPHGYLVLPYLVFAIGGYALGMPMAARVQLAEAVVLYPLARWAGLGIGAEVGPAAWMVVLETVFLLGTGYLATSGPIAYTRRLRRVRQALARAQEGDFSARLPDRHLDDIGFLSVSVNLMSQTVGEMVRQIQEHSRSLANLSDVLARATDEVHAAAQVIGEATTEAADDAGQQLTLVAGGEETAASLARESAGLREEAVRSAGAARGLRGEAEAHAARVEKAGALLVELGDDYRRLEDAVGALEAAGTRVSGFVDTIREIAEQTNLLALNAAIEAARAGEQGRGFAIVAGEVRGLAAQAGTSADEVAAVVGETARALAELRERLHAGTGRIGGVGAVAGAGRDSLGMLVSGLAQTVDVVEGIAGGVDRQAGSVGALREDVRRIRALAEASLERALQAAAAAEGQRQAMRHLADTSQRTAGTAATLDALAARFRAAANAAPAPHPAPAAETAPPPVPAQTRPRAVPAAT